MTFEIAIQYGLLSSRLYRQANTPRSERADQAINEVMRQA